MITPEQKKKIMIMAGVFLTALIALVVILVLPKKNSGAPAGNTTTTSQPSPPTSPAGNASNPVGPNGTNTPGSPTASAPPMSPQGNMPPPGMNGPGMIVNRPGAPSNQSLVPPTVLPSLTPPASLSSRYDPFSGGPRPPQPPRIRPKVPFLRPIDEIIYNRIVDKAIKISSANVKEGEIYIAYIPFVHNSTMKAMPYVPVPRKEEYLEAPPGRHAGYVYSEGGKVYAIFEDSTHTPRPVSVGDNLNGYTVKSIGYDSMILTKDNHDYLLKLQPIDSFQWGQSVNVDAVSNTPVNAPPRWGNR